jgi:hypothetical protein
VGHLGYFHSLTIINNGAVNMGVQGVFIVKADSHSFGFIHTSGIAGLYDSSILGF